MRLSLAVLFVILTVPTHSFAETTTQDYLAILETNLPTAKAAYNQGLRFESEDNPVKAIEAYKKSITYNPNIKEPYNNLGAIYYELGLYKQAVPSLKKALEIDPDYPLAQSNLGLTYYAMKRYSDAVRHFEAARIGLPKLRDNLYFLARAYTHREEYQKAADALEDLLLANEEFYPGHFDLALVYMIQNKPKRALVHFERVLEISPDHVERDEIELAIRNIKKLDLEHSD